MFKGSIPALVTPFGESGVDFDALKAIVEWHIEQGLARGGGGRNDWRKPYAHTRGA